MRRRLFIVVYPRDERFVYRVGECSREGDRERLRAGEPAARRCCMRQLAHDVAADRLV